MVVLPVLLAFYDRERNFLTENDRTNPHIGFDHLAFLSSERIDAMSDEEYAHLLDYQLKATQEPNIAGASLHGLWIGRK